jgi:hypothetical protein
MVQCDYFLVFLKVVYHFGMFFTRPRAIYFITARWGSLGLAGTCWGSLGLGGARWG